MGDSRVLFARVGWMHYYHNLMPDDKPVGGGSYNDDHTGSEVANFYPWKGHVYGFIQGIGEAPLSLERIDKNAGSANKLSNVLVLFVARRPEGGQVLVGWYRNATVSRFATVGAPHPRGRQRAFNAIASANQAVLLPTRKRTLAVATGAGGFGQANVCYPLHPAGTSKMNPWMKKLIHFTDSYDGSNLMFDHSIDEVEDTVDRLENISAGSGGQGFAQNAAQRRAIERLAMSKAMKHFRRVFSTVTDVCRDGRSYDIHCQKGRKVLWVEVKGTTGDGKSVFLTRREYELAKKGKSALFVLHSVHLKGNRATGGSVRVLAPWNVENGKAVPVAYAYTLPG